MSDDELNKILLIFSKVNPKPQTELKFSSDFELLISVVLSAQSTDRMVNKVTKSLYGIANTPVSILSMGLHSLREKIKQLGLFNKKAVNIINICIILINKYQGRVPNNMTDLTSLPGVGRKTANVILNCIFKKNVIAVDTHVFRVCNRIGIIKEKTVFDTEMRLLKIVPESFKLYFHNWFVLHGRYVCSSKLPKCSICLISHLCKFKHKRM